VPAAQDPGSSQRAVKRGGIVTRTVPEPRRPGRTSTSGYTRKALHSRFLTVYLFAVILVSGVWIGTPALFPLTWITALAVGAATQTITFRLPLPAGAAVRANARDALLAIVASAPAVIYLIATWHQEFPYLGDQSLHSGSGIEAYAFWWPWGWIAAVTAMAFVVWRVRRNGDSPAALIGLAIVVAIGLALPQPLAFSGRYPGTLHFFSVPLRAVMHATSPLNVERLLNALAIPAWLLVLRPLVVRRHVDVAAMTIAALLFWQKDDVYYFTSGYLEPWAIVLLLTAAEHLVRYGADAVWRPLLLLGAAAMVKEQLIMSLPIVAAVYFPFRGTRRAQVEHFIVSVVAATPFVPFWRARELFKTWSLVSPAPGQALGAAHFALFRERISLQFGLALPLVIVSLVLLIVFAAQRRAFAALLLMGAADFGVIYFAKIQQPWAGYPRLNLVPLAMATVALSYAAERLAERHRMGGATIVVIAAALNCIGLAPAIRDGFRPSSARSFIEHFDAPLFFPIRETLAAAERTNLIAPKSRIDLLTNGKHIFAFFWVGPLEDQYPDLSARYRLRSESFAGMTARCRCTDASTAHLAVFIRFAHLGEHIPQRTAAEAEANECTAEILRTCTRTMPVTNEGVLVGMFGEK